MACVSVGEKQSQRLATPSVFPMAGPTWTENIFPLSHTASPVHCTSPGSLVVQMDYFVFHAHLAPDARAVTSGVAIKSRVAVLNPALRIIRIYVTQFDFRKYDPGQPME